ncbi:DUF1307 domain-containing protein [Gemella cuniculi]|uniref:DUF1307 domain-containing protein n=1 Tax=Gemella cuniculi TaxID=150240 RepID=UPI000400475B|nr:DUF1307 domain-containing protein [Gemella cuniculi]
MKKILKLCSILFIAVFVLTACSSEKTKVYTNKVGQQEFEITIHYKGDTVNKLSSVSTISDLGTDPKSAIESIRSSINMQRENIQGVTYDVEEKDEKAIIKMEIDYTKIDYDKDKEKLGLTASSFDEEKKLSYIEKRLTEAGAKEKK